MASMRGPWFGIASLLLMGATALPAQGAEKDKDKAKDETVSVAVFPLRAKPGVEAVTAELLTLTIVDELRTVSSFALVMSPHEVGVRLSPKEQEQLMDCASDRCAMLDTEMAGALGVSHMLVGSIFKVDKELLLNLKLLDLRTALEVASVSRRMAGSTNAMLASAKSLLGELLKKCKFLKPLGKESATAAPPPPPPPPPRRAPQPETVTTAAPAPAPVEAEASPAPVTTLMAVPDPPTRPAPEATTPAPAAAAAPPPRVVPLWAPGVLGGGVTGLAVGVLGLVGTAVMGTLATMLLGVVYVVPVLNLLLFPDSSSPDTRLPRLAHGSQAELMTAGAAWALAAVGAVLVPVVLVLIVGGAVATSAGGALSRE
ncbi:MAG: hypothetical protein AB2A00_26575 [Myxococcota bacterium]